MFLDIRVDVGKNLRHSDGALQFPKNVNLPFVTNETDYCRCPATFMGPDPTDATRSMDVVTAAEVGERNFDWLS